LGSAAAAARQRSRKAVHDLDGRLAAEDQARQHRECDQQHVRDTGDRKALGEAVDLGLTLDDDAIHRVVHFFAFGEASRSWGRE
jgi:hypothetical protein